jgi:hypothetical protein
MRNSLLQFVLPLAALALSACVTSTPIGTIVAYGGDAFSDAGDSAAYQKDLIMFERSLDEKWLVCDGRLKSVEDYPKLAATIGNAWGTLGDKFYLPDLQGLFLRGVNACRTDEYKDPDTLLRRSVHGGHERNLVGSIQSDTLRRHTHRYDAPPSGPEFKGQNPGNIPQTPIRHIETDSSGGNETRPKNAYVYYLIRAK